MQQRRVLLVFLMLLFTVFSANASDKIHKIQTGESLFSIFSDKLSAATILNLEKEIKRVVPDFTLRIGTIVKISPASVTISPDSLTDISVNLLDDDFNLEVTNHPVHTVTTIAHGVVESSLTDAMVKAGEGIELAFMLADIYEWEIDFFHALRKGDSFSVLVEKKFAKDRFIGYGKILAADFVNQGRFLRALYYEYNGVKGYYDVDGKSLKKGFLKAPLKFTRISSTYTGKRLHPVLNRYIPHHGVDYAAPVGTPIHATSDGVVLNREYNQFNGNYVKIRHLNGYETLYLHLSKFAKIRKGSKVSQGSVIGYVGSTGISTGPHLDYRIKQYGKFLNPLTFTSPNLKLPKSQRTAFKEAVKPLVAKINTAYGRDVRFTLLRNSHMRSDGSLM
ncbi:peptidoglycan DD-metalloendopeptidase family protein [Seleniivibrio sp.]|uniref:peptidoglycan DD-metalloendopeptidase family protein n=1 Tax=Seleniivibrio sp. TaxID=2898801 RepID=UPI0025FDBF1B|nr:peptidoglycan DD-metalloendopeptidase family protein [Seleniivibrio sp.]MCD8553809.1 peptidoglycan DD-metalloendopeptidase family protein [Seleniivibrio sp.]